MAEPEHLKCPCTHCGENIEFPPHGVGLAVTCPHCGQETTLTLAPGSSPPLLLASSPKRTTPAVVLLWVLIPVLAFAAAGVVGWKFWKRARMPVDSSPPAPTTRMEEPRPMRQLEPKSPADLKSGPVMLERGQGSLLYAVGKIHNDSAHQRFGVKIELELVDAAGKKVGTATDYTRLIEPHAEWRFKALIFESKVTSANVSSIQEEE